LLDKLFHENPINQLQSNKQVFIKKILLITGVLKSVLRERPISKYSSITGPISKKINLTGNGTSVILPLIKRERNENKHENNLTDNLTL